MIMCGEIRELTETFFVDDESCVFTFDGSTLQWRDKLVSVSNLVTIDFVHSGNCCSAKRSKIFFRKVPHRCEGHDKMVVRYAESQKKNRLRLTSVKIRGEGKQLTQWFRMLRCSLETVQRERAKEFLVFINPFSGRQNGVEVYMKKVKPIFEAANKVTTIVITKNRSDFGKVINCGIDGYDAILAVGGDGTVSEIVNSLIISRMESLLSGMDREEVVVPRIDIPIGIIPCGSTDCVAYTLNGTRDAETNALHAILGNRSYFDVCRATFENGVNRFFISVFTYGYLSDLIKESEKFRWMGPIRYNYAGLLTLLRSKEYYGQIDMKGIQIGRKPSGTRVHKDESFLSLASKKVVHKKSSSFSFSRIPIVPTVEPGSGFIRVGAERRSMVPENGTKCGGDASDAEGGRTSNDSATVEGEEKMSGERRGLPRVEDGLKCEPSTSEDRPNYVEKPPEGEGEEVEESMEDIMKPNGSRVSQDLVPFAMELIPVTSEEEPPEKELTIRGRYFLIACANISCSSELTPNGIAPNCVPGDGNMNVILFQPNSICDLYKMYARLTSRDKGSLLTELPFITIYRTRRVKISVAEKDPAERNSANCDGELFHVSLVDIKIHESIIQFYTRRQNRID